MHQSDQTPDLRRRSLLRSFACLGFGTVCSVPAKQASASELEVGKPAPILVLHTLDGRTIATHDLLGQVVIVTFWATWCKPCQKELPLLSDYADSYRSKGLQVLGFSLDGPEDLPQVRSMASRLSFPVGLLGNPWAGDYGRIWRIPVSFVIDRAGCLVDNGWEDDRRGWTKERLQRVVDPLLLRND